jgi:hypothetical protein
MLVGRERFGEAMQAKEIRDTWRTTYAAHQTNNLRLTDYREATMRDGSGGAIPQVARLGGRLGAAVHGVDLSDSLDEGMMKCLRAALYEHCALVIPKQNLRADQFAEFAARWGELHMMQTQRLDENPYIFKLEKDPERATPGTDM